MTITPFRFCLCLATLCMWSAPASATVLFSDDFNIDSSGSWTTNVAPAANTGTQQALFAFNYGDFGIPAAPGSSDTLGLQLKANIPGSAAVPVTTRPAGVLSGLSVSPTGMNFGTNYQMTFYAWSNYFGAPNANALADNAASEGGTNNVMFAVGTSGTVPIVVGNTALAVNGVMDGVGFATTGDGGIASDYRVYPASGTFTPATTAGVYAAGNTATSTSSSNAFYTALFPSTTAPAIQQTISTTEYDDGSDAGAGDTINTQKGSTPAGSFGFAWQKVVITKNNNTVTWAINDTLIATANAATLTLGGANIALGVSDVNTTTARHHSLVFTVFDNLVVTDLPPVGPAGDYTGDGKVDGADFLKWQRGESPNPTSAGDLATWQANFGAGGALASATAVPEPGSIGLGLLGAALASFGLRRSRS